MATSKFPGTTGLTSQKIILVSQVTYSEVAGGSPVSLTSYPLTASGLARVSWYAMAAANVPGYLVEYGYDPGNFYGPSNLSETFVSTFGLDSANLSISWKNIGFRTLFNLNFEVWKDGVYNSSQSIQIPDDETYSSPLVITAGPSEIWSIVGLTMALA